MIRNLKSTPKSDHPSNELAVVEFCVGDTHFAMDIKKIREIIKADIAVVPVPNAHAFIEGAINLRGEILPVINLAKQLNKKCEKEDQEKKRIIICEFPKMKAGMLVTSVFNIHRTKLDKVETPADLLQMEQGYTSGVIKVDDTVLFILDYQKIMQDINPRIGNETFNANDRESNTDGRE